MSGWLGDLLAGSPDPMRSRVIDAARQGAASAAAPPEFMRPTPASVPPGGADAVRARLLAAAGPAAGAAPAAGMGALRALGWAAMPVTGAVDLARQAFGSGPDDQAPARVALRNFIQGEGGWRQVNQNAENVRAAVGQSFANPTLFSGWSAPAAAPAPTAPTSTGAPQAWQPPTHSANGRLLFRPSAAENASEIASYNAWANRTPAQVAADVTRRNAEEAAASRRQIVSAPELAAYLQASPPPRPVTAADRMDGIWLEGSDRMRQANAARGYTGDRPAAAGSAVAQARATQEFLEAILQYRRGRPLPTMPVID